MSAIETGYTIKKTLKGKELEGKEYLVKDGDIMHFRFAV